MALLRSVAAGLAACGLAVLCAPPAHACGESRTARAGRVNGRVGRAPLIIGDSTLLLSVRKFASVGIEANGRGCRQFSEGLSLLAARKRARDLPAVVIIALGANGAIRAGQIPALLRLAGRRRIVVLVTPRNQGASRAQMRAAARAHPDRVLLADWSRYSRSRQRGGWFAGDGLHVSYAGADAYVRFIRRMVAPVAFPPVKLLRLPRRSADAAKACGDIRRGRVFVLRGKARITCSRARTIARRPPMKHLEGWRTYDWRRTGNGPWDWVKARTSRRVVVAVIEHRARRRVASRRGERRLRARRAGVPQTLAQAGARA